jgi:hypothetical protein
MKKVNLLFMIMLTIAVGIFNSCTEEESDPPTIAITETGSPTYAPGTSVTYHLLIAANEDLVDFWGEQSTTSSPGHSIANVDPADAFEEGDWVNFTNNLTKVEFDYTYNIPTTVGDGTEITIDFEVNDKEALAIESVTFTVVAEVQFGHINIFGEETMGSWLSSEGSYYASADGSVFNQTQVVGHESEVDFVFYFGDTNGATLCAPSDSELQAGGSLVDNYVCKDWTSPNATKFGANTTVTWTEVTDDEQIVGTSATLSAATNLSADDVIPFETVDGKKGLIKINGITGGSGDGEITIEIKVQQ